MNSRLDWLVLSDYYSIYVTNAPPKNSETRSVFPNFFSSIVGFERVGSRLVKQCLVFQGERADQTTDETVVCNPGVIATQK